MVSATAESQEVLDAIEALLMAKKKAAKRDSAEREARAGDVPIAEIAGYLQQARDLAVTLQAAQRAMDEGRLKAVYMDGKNRPKRGLEMLSKYADELLSSIRTAYREAGKTPPSYDTLTRIADTE